LLLPHGWVFLAHVGCMSRPAGAVTDGHADANLENVSGHDYGG
jgi:hypothetical protein